MTAAPETLGRASGLRAAQRWIADRPALVLLVILGLLMLSTNLASPGFLSAKQLSTWALFAAPLGLMAAGQTLVMLTGGIDLSVAANATAAAYIMSAYGTKGTLTALAIGLGIGLVIGLVNGIAVGIFGVQPLIMTLATGGVTLGLLTVAAQRWFKHSPLVPDVINRIGSARFFGYIPYNLLVWAPLALVIVLGLRYSGFGRTLYAVGDNPLACRLAGVRVWQVLVAVYTLCGALSALAGIVLVGYTNAADLGLATPYLLPSVAAVVIGGTSIFGGSGGYTGTIIGALILTVLDSLLTVLDAAQAFKQMLYGAIILSLAWLYARLSGAE